MSIGIILDRGLFDSFLIRENEGKQEFTITLNRNTKLDPIYYFLDSLNHGSKCKYNIIDIARGSHIDDIIVKFEKKPEDVRTVNLHNTKVLDISHE